MATLREQLKDVWGGFLSQTSIHGLQYVTHGHKHFVFRVLWVLVVLAGFVMMIKNLMTLYTEYYQYKYTTNLNIDFKDNLEFPAITLCNTQAYDVEKLNTSSELFKFLSKISNRDANFDDPKWNSTFVSHHNLEAAALGAHDMIRMAYFLQTDLTPLENFFSFTYKWLLCPCITFNGQWNQKDLVPRLFEEDDKMIIYVDVNQDRYALPSSSAGVDLMVHSPDEPVNYRMEQTRLSPGHDYDINLSVKQYTYLPQPYNSFRAQDCSAIDDTSNFKKTLKYFHRYDYSGCLLECLTDLVLDRCGCITEYLVQNASQHICSVRIRIDCVETLLNTYYSYSAVNNLTVQCDCPRPCTNTIYTRELSAGYFPAHSLKDYLIQNKFSPSLEHARSNLMIITISFKNLMVEHVRHSPFTTLSAVFSNIGGLMGIFMGASLLSVVEMLAILLRSLALLLKTSFIKNKPSSPGDTVMASKKVAPIPIIVAPITNTEYATEFILKPEA